MIKLSGIHKTYQGVQPLHVLKGIDLHISKGEFVAIMGASGSGKSTLLNILGILDDYDEGEYLLDNTPIRHLKERQAAHYRNRMIGFIFQSFNLIPFKDAMENVALPLFYQGVSRRKRNELAMQYLEKVGLRDWAHHYPNELSGGQKQRVGIARALANHPKILLCDEATSALDNITQKIVSESLDKEKCTRIVIAHRLSTIQHADNIIVLQHGEIIESGNHQELLKLKGHYYKLYQLLHK